MFHFLFRAVGSIILALALVAAVLDVTRSVAASAIVMTPALESWNAMAPTSLLALKAQLEGWGVAFLWDPVLLKILLLPGWLLCWFVAMLLLWIGQRPHNPYGRFASR